MSIAVCTEAMLGTSVLTCDQPRKEHGAARAQPHGSRGREGDEATGAPSMVQAAQGCFPVVGAMDERKGVEASPKPF